MRCQTSKDGKGNKERNRFYFQSFYTGFGFFLLALGYRKQMNLSKEQRHYFGKILKIVVGIGNFDLILMHSV